MIKCITFDLDDTLWNIEPVINRAEIEFQKWLKMNYHEVYENVSIEQLRKLVRQTALENPKIKHDLTKVRICAYNKLRNIFGLSENMPEDAFNYFMRYRNKVELFDNVEDILSKLKQKYSIGTITNGNASLEKIGIKKYFDFEIKASDVGYMKPNKEIFQAAVDKANCIPSQMVHVGDSYEKDIIGAMSLNMNYIWINHNNLIKDNIESRYVINSFDEIMNVLEKME